MWVYIWLAISIIMFVAEIMTVGLVSIWFAIGALFALIAAVSGVGVAWQIIIFVVTSLICIFLIRSWAKKIVKPKETKTNVNAVIGKEGVVTEPIFKNEYGEVKVDSMKWSAKTQGGEPIERGTAVEVIAVEGVKLIVRAKN